MVNKIVNSIFLIVLTVCFFAPASWARDSYVVHQSFRGPKGKIYAGGLSPDGHYVVMIDKRKTLRIWNYTNGRPLKAIKSGHHRPICMAFHPQKNLLFTGGLDGKIIIWDLRKGQPVQTLIGHKGPVEALAISKDGSMLASGGKDSMIILWRLDRYKITKKILEPTGEVVSLDWHPNNRLLSWANGAGEVKVWDTQAGVMKGTHKLHHSQVTQVRFHPQGAHIVSSGADGQVIFWNYNKKKITRKLQASKGMITGFDFNRRGNALLTCSMKKQIQYWDLRKGKVKETLKLVDKPVLGCQFANGSKSILAVFENTYLRGWNIGDNGFLTTLRSHKKTISSLSVSSNGRYLLSLSVDGQIRLWDVRKMKLISQPQAPPGHRPVCIRFSPNNKKFATCGSNSDILVWSTQTAKVLFKLTGKHKGKINDLAFNPKANQLVSVGADKQVIVWDLKTKRALQQKTVHHGQINQIKFSKNGELYATASADKTAKVFRSFDNQLLYTLIGAKRGVRAVAFSPTHDLIATASDDTILRFYSQSTGAPKGSIKAHEFIITDLGFSPNGRALVTVSKDKTVKLWNPRRISFINTLTGEDHQITAMSLQTNGTRLFVGDLAGDINVIRLPQRVFGQGRTSRKLLFDPQKDVNAATQTQRSEPEKPKKEYSALDVAEEHAGNQRDNVFDPPTASVDQELIALKHNLNQLLKAKNVCTQSDEIESTALKVLRKRADDQSAYYGLMQVYTLHQDIQAVFLMAKLGRLAKFYQKEYNYADPVKVHRFFQVWNDQVFNLSVVKGSGLKLELIDCHNDVQNVTLPKEILYFAVPEEVTAKLLSGNLKVDFGALTGLSSKPKLFQDRLFGLIRSVISGELVIKLATLNKHIPVEGKRGYGTLRLNLDRVNQFGDRRRIKFQLKQGALDWMTYQSDTDQTKSLLLPQGEYYLRVNQKLKKAFMVKAGQQITDKIN